MAPHTERTYVVEGMTCEHCERAVRDEVEAIGALQVVAVDRARGRLVVRGSDVDDAAIRQAVAEAGYAVIGSDR